MSIADRMKALLRRKPMTDEELRERAEAKLIREQMLQDKLSQRSGGGQNYRAGGR